MVKCKNLKDEDLKRIGKIAAESFLSEEGAFCTLKKNDADKMFYIILKTCYESGHLYKTSDREEGFCVYWTKKERPGAWIQLKMAINMMFSLPFGANLLILNSQSSWIPTEKRYKNRNDFVEVFLIFIDREYQGKGYFKNMMRDPFALSQSRNTICVLDTDSKIKAEKYCHEGMRIVESKMQKSGIEMFALEK